MWYSIIVNDTRQGFFSSSRELKQGDPLSPSLFIIVVEVLSRSPNCLYRNPNFIPFSNHANVPKINHLVYAYDIIIFCSGDSISVKLVMNTISKYERSSAQLVNRDKIYFLTAPNTVVIRINMIRNCLGFMDKTFTFTYLGCPLYVRRKKIDYFDSTLSNIVKRLNGWQGVFRLIEKHFANFFWGNSVDHKKYHWSSWKNLALSTEEEGVGVRRMEDISDMLT
ncbi:uncharacterized protein [Nicotiana sylvestris]|uniref:uncharacterized protein n=1 Tax=Nicotiana sylvestris TaxID=4096 RepID=UPI00388C45AE